MGDNITDLPTESGHPPVPPKTYQWEDIRRQKLEGHYPWTHLFKPPFDEEIYEKTKNHEYEPVIPMDSRKTPPPFVKVTAEENKPGLEEEHIQDKHHLCIPSNEEIDDENDYEDDEDDDTEEITAAELQNRLEERYFRQSPDSSKHDYELPETRSVSPLTDDTESTSFQDKVHLQTDKIKQKFKNMKGQISSVENSPCVKRKKDDGGKKQVKKNKFNFRKHAKLPDRSNFRMPQAPRLSFSSLSSFSRSRSNSVKERERKRSQSSESDSQKKRFDFNFSTYPRIFKRKKNETAEKQNTPMVAHKSAPSSPSTRRSPFPQRWISKFTDHKKDVDKKEEKKEEKKPQSKKQNVVEASIFISLHEDTTSTSAPQSEIMPEQPIAIDDKPLSMKVDNKNFIFVSLHEERFPEKLQKQEQEVGNDEAEIKKVDTARKFTSLLRKLETDRKLKSKRFTNRTDDKPEPVTITEITTDEEGDNHNSNLNLENSVETPEDTSEEIRPSSTEPPSWVEDDTYETQRSKEQSRAMTPEPTRSRPKTPDSPIPQEKQQEPKSPVPQIKSLRSIFAKIKTTESPPPAESSKPVFTKAKTPESQSRTESLKSIFIKAKTPESASRADSPKSIFTRAKTPESSKSRTESPKSIFTKAKTPEFVSRPESPKLTFFKAKTPEYTSRPASPKSTFFKDNTPESTSRPESPKSTLFKPKTPESSSHQPKTPKSILRSKSPDPSVSQTKSLKSIFTRAKTPEPPEPQTKSLKSLFTRAKTPDPPSSPTEPKESKFGKLKEILKDTEKFIKPNNENKDKESKKFAEFRENLFKETEKIGTLKNKIKNYFAKETDSRTTEPDDKHIYEEFDNIDEPVKNSKPEAPHKAPRKKLKKLDSDNITQESLSAFEDAALNDIITLDEQKPMTKTYIKASLEEVHDIPVEPDQSLKHFRNYEKALQKTTSYSSIEIDNHQYSTNNTLARLEAPIPPSRPSRTRSLQRNKRVKPTIDENKENYDAQQNYNFNTFPLIKPDKPRRKFRKHRTYSNSTNTDVKSVTELEDATISQNIANSKQLSVSFLPLTSNIVGEPILNYNLRETSSMIHLNLNSDPPLPPKRRKSSAKDTAGKYNTLPNRKYCSKTSSKTSLDGSETCNGIHADVEDFEYADDVNSTAASDTPPRRPSRKRSAAPSLFDEDRTSREIESLPSEKSLCDSDSKDINGYAVIKPAQKSHSQPTTIISNTTPRRKSRRLSDFFTIPRIRLSTNNYVSPASTLTYERRLPSPSRPPRKSKPFIEPFYTNEENINVTDLDFEAEEELNFNLATVEDDILEVMEKDEKNLQTDEVMERMKIRPLPAPPRPTRKPRDEKEGYSYDYSLVKKNSNQTNNLNQDSELKIINTNVEPKEPEPQAEPPSNVIVKSVELKNVSVEPSSSSTLNVITAEKLDVSEMNVAKLSISEIESSKLVTSSVDSVTMQVSDIRSEAGNLVINSVQLRSSSPIIERLSPVLQEFRSPSDDTLSIGDVTPSSEEAVIPETSARSRISSMIPEVGSDEESTSTVTKVVRPNRRKPVKKEPSSSTVPETNQPTLAELMCQILQICHSSVGQAIHSLLEQIIPEDREKRNEVQAAIWVITIIVAGCLMLGLQTNEKIVHHHHWDFHFPPPH